MIADIVIWIFCGIVGYFIGHSNGKAKMYEEFVDAFTAASDAIANLPPHEASAYITARKDILTLFTAKFL